MKYALPVLMYFEAIMFIYDELEHNSKFLINEITKEINLYSKLTFKCTNFSI